MINNSRIICLGSDALASEALKNIILSGIGYVTILDDKIISEKDLKENFFVNRKDLELKRLRGESVLENLLELNDDCKGEFMNISIKNFLENEAILLQKYDLIISSNNSLVKIKNNFYKYI